MTEVHSQVINESTVVVGNVTAQPLVIVNAAQPAPAIVAVQQQTQPQAQTETHCESCESQTYQLRKDAKTGDWIITDEKGRSYHYDEQGKLVRDVEKSPPPPTERAAEQLYLHKTPDHVEVGPPSLFTVPPATLPVQSNPPPSSEKKGACHRKDLKAGDGATSATYQRVETKHETDSKFVTNDKGESFYVIGWDKTGKAFIGIKDAQGHGYASNCALDAATVTNLESIFAKGGKDGGMAGVLTVMGANQMGYQKLPACEVVHKARVVARRKPAAKTALTKHRGAHRRHRPNGGCP